MSFANKVIVITGASDGIGAEIALQIASERPRLVLAARNAHKLARIRQQCQERGAEAIDVVVDVAREEDCRQLIEHTATAFGDVDILVANAGVSMHARFDAIEDFSTFERLFRINAMGTIWCVRYAYPALKRTHGLIVGVSSLAGKTGVPHRTTYCTSKFAQTGFLEALRIEAAEHGVDVLTVYPGVVATEIRRHGWNGRGEQAGVSGLSEQGAMSVEECARQIVAAMRTRRRELVMTAKGRVGLWLKLAAPALVDRMARRALARTSEQQERR